MATAVALLAAAGAFAGGIVLGRKRKRRPLFALAPLAAAAVAIRGAFGLWSTLPVTLLPFDFYPAIETWWAWPFGLFLCGVGVAFLPSLITRDIALVVIGLALVFFSAAAWGESFGGASKLKGRVDETGVCEQTSFYSCGAASAAMLLHSYRIPASEREMAERCHTHYMFGTSLSGFVRGLGWSIPEGREGVRAARLTFDELAALERPCIVVIRLTSLANHAVIVDQVRGDQIRVRDPRGVTQDIPRSRFEDQWVGYAIWLVARPGSGG